MQTVLYLRGYLLLFCNLMCFYIVVILIADVATLVDNIDATELRGRDNLQFACRLLEVRSTYVHSLI